MTHFGIRPGLERIEYLLNALGNPHKDYPVVHIAGTNGKGTVTEIVSRVLESEGYIVGKFTSPHLHDYTERFEINGRFMSYGMLSNYLNDIENIIPYMEKAGLSHPTEFEVLTAIAFTWFRDENVDIAAMEVGMGGTWDSTNIIIPAVSVITGIDFDHTAILGNTLAEIAENKAGIIKKNIPVAVGILPQEAENVIKKRAAEMSSPLKYSRDISVDLLGMDPFGGQRVKVNGFPGLDDEPFHYNLYGIYQRQNLSTALTALSFLSEKGWRIDPQSIKIALERIKMPGRLEVVKENPTVLLDVAHNPQGAMALGKSLKEIFPDRKKVLVCAILDDKDASTMMKSLSENTSEVIFTHPLGERGKNWHRLIEIWKRQYPEIPACEEENIEKAARLGVEQCKKREGEYLLITGSFYLMDSARRCFVDILGEN